SVEMIRNEVPLYPVAASRLRTAAAFTSAMAVMLVVGMTAGLVFSEPERPGGATVQDASLLVPDGYRASTILLPQAVSSRIHPRFSSVESVTGPLAPVEATAAAALLAADSLQGALLLRRSRVAP